MDEIVGDLEWDIEKRTRALVERGMDFAHVAFINRDSLQTIEDARFDYGEERFNSFGYLDGVLCVFCWTPRGQRRRIISMRKQMTANAAATKRARTPGTLEGIQPGESLDDFERRVGDDIPELTSEDFARAKPISEFPDLARALDSAREAMRARGQRGLQKAPTKERVTLRLDRDVVARYREGGPGWQTRLNDDLVKLHKRRGVRP